MSRVFIPPALRRLTGGRAELEATGGTLRAVIDELDSRHPGLRSRLCEEDRLRPGLSVVIGSSIGSASLLQPVPDDAEVHFLPAVGGG
jgi:molybdopterin synthase sulfur carrier subunit